MARRNRGQERAREFGRSHPRLAVVIVFALLAGVIAVCAFQLGHGAYLGRAWEISAAGGMATAVLIAAVVLLGRRRDSLALARFEMAWLVLCVMSASAIRYPFPIGPYDGVQAFFNVVHAALLGFEAVTLTGIEVLLAYLLIRSRGRSGPLAVRPPLVRAASRARAAHGLDRIPARLRFPSAQSSTWRAGRLIAANGTVTWRSLNGDAELDLTSACQALSTLSADPRMRQPRTTTLSTADGLVEVDVSPIALQTLSHRQG